ncbi:MAG: protein kinase, partial [Planctomycetes bacterium]|nr:protein kinase [Planctomycetota bacterium]
MSASPADDPTLPESLEDQVLAILDGDEDGRGDALRQLLENNPGHAATIRAWLTSADVAVPAPDGSTQAANPDALPRDLGCYRLVEIIGRGGFGTVFRAEQQRPIRRAVAVKVINPGMDSRELLARFHAEREALNRMDHPGIARLLDAGTTDRGRPFFVMELVVGPPLATLCRQRELPLEQRIELFLQVLDATQHAHQKAVIH